MTDRKDDFIEQFTYWGEHPDYPEDDWKYEVAEGNTKRGYWDWVVKKLEEMEEDEKDD